MNNPNCLYKQLKRKEQECEKINLTNERLVAEKYIMNEEILKLKLKQQECEELIKEKAEIKKYLGISDKTIIQRLEELQEFKDKLKISEYNYKQALDEIEKIVKQTCSQRCTNGCSRIKKHCGYGHILNIINKAKEK